MIQRAAGVNSEQMEDENGDREDDEDGNDSDYECEEADLEIVHMTLKQKLMRSQKQRQRKKTSMENLMLT